MARSQHIGSMEERTAQLAIELRVSNLQRSIAFYRAVGFELERQTETFAALRIDGRYLFLDERHGAAAGPNPPNLRIAVIDASRGYEQALSRGWVIKHPLADHGYGLIDFTIKDPDGYEVRFASLAD